MNPDPRNMSPRRFRPAGPLLRVFVGVIVFSFVLLGHAPSTLRPQYAAIAVGMVGYALVCRGSLVDGLYGYLMSRYMAPRWWLAAWMVLSLTWSVDTAAALQRIASFGLIYLAALVVFDAVRNHGQMKFVLMSIFYAAGVCALITDFSLAHITILDRPASIFGNPNIVALICLAGLVVYLFREDAGEGWKVVWLQHGLSLALFTATFMSASRKGLLGAAILCLFAVGRRAPRRRLLVTAALALPVVIVGLSVSSMLLSRSVLTASHLQTLVQIGDGATETDVSFAERESFLRIGFERFAESPVTGHGLESFRVLSGAQTYSHNNYMEMAFSLGIVGLLLYYGFHVHLLLASMVQLRGTNEGAIAVVFLVMALVLDVGFVSYIFKPWILFFVMVAGYLSRREDSPWVAPDAPARTGEPR